MHQDADAAAMARATHGDAVTGAEATAVVAKTVKTAPEGFRSRTMITVAVTAATRAPATTVTMAWVASAQFNASWAISAPSPTHAVSMAPTRTC
jgi:hypothetical protein